MIGDLATSLRGHGTEPGTTEEATVGWSGKARPQPDIYSLVRRYRLLLLPGTCGPTLWRWPHDAQGAAGGGARSGLN